MPVQYGSVLAEHRAVRGDAGWFDVTHLGRFELSGGTGAEQALLGLLSNDITRIAPGQTQYTLMLDYNGGIIDDLVVWWWEPGRYWVFPERGQSSSGDEPHSLCRTRLRRSRSPDRDRPHRDTGTSKHRR